MNDNADQDAVNELAAFHELWLNSLSKTMQAAAPLSPGAAPPGVLRRIRSGNFEALAKWWAEVMRSPQSLGGMKQWMSNVTCFRKTTREFLAKVRHDLQAPSHDDMDTLILTVRHMERRLLDKVHEVSNAARQLRQLPAKRTPLRRLSMSSSRKTKTSSYSGSERAESDTVGDKLARAPL